MKLWKYDKARKRIWICNKRIHHGAAGLLLFCAGVWLMKDDWHDFPWTRDE